MKCLIYLFHGDVDKLFNHYVIFYNIKKTNSLLKALFEQRNVFYKRKCKKWDEIFYSDNEINKHNF